MKPVEGNVREQGAGEPDLDDIPCDCENPPPHTGCERQREFKRRELRRIQPAPDVAGLPEWVAAARKQVEGAPETLRRNGLVIDTAGARWWTTATSLTTSPRCWRTGRG